MNIAKRPNGKWRARYRDETGKEHSRHFDRKLDGQRWLDEVTTSIVTGQYVDPRAGNVTFASYYALWSDRQFWAPGTRRAMNLAAAGTTFSNLPLRALRRSHVESWIKAMSDGTGFSRPLKPGTIRTRFNNVRTVVRAAVDDRIIPTDPTIGVKIPRKPRHQPMSIPAPSEVGSLLDAADAEFSPFIALCAFAGLRLGEAAGVQVGDFDFGRRELHVRRQVQRADGGIELRDPKAQSNRTVYVPDQLLKVVSEHIRKRGLAGKPESWLFRGATASEPPHQNTVGHRWRTTLKGTNLTYTLHDLRHFYASGLIAAGCDVVTVQKALGHSSAKITLDTYAHLWPDHADRTRAAAAGLFEQSITSSPTSTSIRHDEKPAAG